jgi:hypothetical protein
MTSKSQQRRIELMKEGDKVREWWTNYMGMSSSFDEAKWNWPEAEWEDLRCYVEESAYRKLQGENARLREALELVIGLCEYCGDFSNGTTCGGYDEGQVLANRTIAEAKKALK